MIKINKKLNIILLIAIALSFKTFAAQVSIDDFELEPEVITELNEDATKVNNVIVCNIVEDNGNYYCYDSFGPVTNAWRKIDKSSYGKFAPVDKFPNNYIWAYFQSSGKAIKANHGQIKKININGNTYAFNEYGQMLQGFFNESGDMWDEKTEEDPFNLVSGNGCLYHADEQNGVLTKGWYKYPGTTSRYPNKDTIWMYFHPSTCKAVRTTGNNYKKATIDGLQYAFDDKGVMLTGFEPNEYNKAHGGDTSKTVYFN